MVVHVYGSTCISRHLQLRTGQQEDFAGAKFYCPHALADCFNVDLRFFLPKSGMKIPAYPPLFYILCLILAFFRYYMQGEGNSAQILTLLEVLNACDSL